MFEKAKWITAAPYLQWRCPDTPQELPASSYITKSFFAEDVPRRAVLNIVGYGQAAYFVNGKRIKDSILPTHPSNPQRAVIYNIYDITSLLLRGRNRIGAILGNNGANDMNVTRWRFEPKLAAQIDIEYKKGT